jgi:hypothetical protein
MLKNSTFSKVVEHNLKLLVGCLNSASWLWRVNLHFEIWLKILKSADSLCLFFFPDILVSPPKTERNTSNWRCSFGFTNSIRPWLASGKECPGSFRFHFFRFSPDTNSRPWFAEARTFLYICSSRSQLTKVK